MRFYKDVKTNEVYCSKVCLGQVVRETKTMHFGEVIEHHVGECSYCKIEFTEEV